MPTYARDALEMTAVWLVLVTRYQRWSRGHKARGQFQGQGHKKIRGPGQGQAFPRTDPLEAKDRNAQGQEQSRKCSPKKRSSKKFFR